MAAEILRKTRLARFGWRCLIGAVLVCQPGVAGSVTHAVSRVSMPVAVSGLAKTADENHSALREAILQLGETESANYPSALEKVLQAPRPQVLAILRDDLASAPQLMRATLDAVVVLRARELLPELKSLAKQTEFWWVFADLNALVTGDEEGSRDLTPIYLTRLGTTLSTTARVAVLNGLASFHAGLPAAVFNDLVDSESYEVRIATVRHWLKTRDLLSETERHRRLEMVLQLRPRQARLIALREVPRMPASERAHLNKNIFKERCEAETDSATREACRKAEKSLGGRP